jgi:hypothetical protein
MTGMIRACTNVARETLTAGGQHAKQAIGNPRLNRNTTTTCASSNGNFDMHIAGGCHVNHDTDLEARLVAIAHRAVARHEQKVGSIRPEFRSMLIEIFSRIAREDAEAYRQALIDSVVAPEGGITR